MDTDVGTVPKDRLLLGAGVRNLTSQLLEKLDRSLSHLRVSPNRRPLVNVPLAQIKDTDSVPTIVVVTTYGQKNKNNEEMNLRHY